MQSKVFDSALMGIFENLLKLNNDFVEDTSFSDTCSLAKTLQSLASQVNNLRVFLVDGYHDRFYTAKTNTEFIDIIYG